MSRANGSTSSKKRMRDMVTRVTMVKDKEKRSKDGLASSIVRKTKEVNPRRAERMEKRGWEKESSSTRW